MNRQRTVRRPRPEDAREPNAPEVPVSEPEAPAPDHEPDPPARRLATDDLLALADMDRDELAALMEGNLDVSRPEVGSRVTGVVTRVGAKDVFIDLGGKSEGRLERAELPEVVLGDEVSAFVLRAGDQGVTLSLRLRGAAAAEHLIEAVASGIPVDGVVASRNPGGFEIRIGNVRAFCPMSMISRFPTADPDALIGQVLQFRVIEADDKIVVSRRVLQEEEAEVRAGELWTTLDVDQEFVGIVRNVLPFGAFVDIGGVEGLVPRRELSWGGDDPVPGQSLDVRVIEIDRDTRKITLSAKQPADDPWHQVGTRFHTGGVYEGTVVRVQPFGAFVELGGGLQGLAHVSRLAAGAPAVGDAVNVRILSVDHDRRRLELSPVADGEVVPEGGPIKGTVSQVLRNGVVVQLDDGRTGWLPAKEVELPAGTVLAQRYRTGKVLEARVINDQGQRVTLSMRADPAVSEREWRAHTDSTQSGGGFGTFGDLLGGLKVDR